MARDQGWSLSEHGFTSLDDETQTPTSTFATEAEVYDFLGLPFIDPELREDRGEIEAALAGKLPTLVTRDDLQGDCHTHSDWSDGHYPIERMAARGAQPRPALPGPDRSHAEPVHRQRPHSRARRAGAPRSSAT